MLTEFFITRRLTKRKKIQYANANTRVQTDNPASRFMLKSLAFLERRYWSQELRARAGRKTRMKRVGEEEKLCLNMGKACCRVLRSGCKCLLEIMHHVDAQKG